MQAKRRLILASVFLASMLPAFGGAVGFAAETARPVVDAAKLEKISQRMQPFVDAKQAAGVVMLAAHRGRVVYSAAVGHADLEKQRPMQTDSLFAIASMTKPVTATALMMLVDEGKLSLDDPVMKFIPAYKGLQYDGRPLEKPLTIRHLLTHTSGIAGDQRNRGSLAETADWLAGPPLKFQPGEKWMYGPGLSIAGRVVEVASQKPFEQFLAERIFQPLKMVDTSFRPTPEQQTRLAKIYKPGADKKSLAPTGHWLVETHGNNSPNPSGGLFSTASDLARFYQMILNGGELDGVRIVSAASVKEMTRIQTGDLTTGFTNGNGWGLGWCVVRQPQGVTRMLSPGTYGHGGAFGTQGWIDPQRKMIFVMLVQRMDFGNSDDSDLRNAFQQAVVEAVSP